MNVYFVVKSEHDGVTHAVVEHAVVEHKLQTACGLRLDPWLAPATLDGRYPTCPTCREYVERTGEDE